MAIELSFLPSFGTTITSPDVTTSTSVPVPVEAPPVCPGGIDELVTLYQSNTFLLDELRHLKVKRARVLAYLATPGCNQALAKAQIEQLRTRHSATLTILRANRLTAQRLCSERRA